MSELHSCIHHKLASEAGVEPEEKNESGEYELRILKSKCIFSTITESKSVIILTSKI